MIEHSKLLETYESRPEAVRKSKREKKGMPKFQTQSKSKNQCSARSAAAPVLPVHSSSVPRVLREAALLGSTGKRKKHPLLVFNFLKGQPK